MRGGEQRRRRDGVAQPNPARQRRCRAQRRSRCDAWASRWLGKVIPEAESSPDLKCSGGEVGGCSGRRGRGEERARGAGWGHGGAGEGRWRSRGGVGGRWAGTRGGGDRRRRSRAPVELEEEDEQGDHFAITGKFRGWTENNNVPLF